MDIVTIDLETFYSQEYSLSKMPTDAYVHDRRFEVIGLGIKINNGETDWYSGDNWVKFLQGYDFSNTAILGWNTVFDAYILHHKAGLRPKVWLDGMSMFRGIWGPEISASLANAAKWYKLGEKGTEVIAAMGKRRRDFTPAELHQYGDYCINDVELTWQLWQKMAPAFPPLELKLIDLTLRMFIEPELLLDKPGLEGYLTQVQGRKQVLLDMVKGNALPDDASEDTQVMWTAMRLAFPQGLTKKDLMSNPKFADALRALGVEPPIKLSPTTGKPTLAFAKTDQEFLALQEHENPAVQALVAARLGTKSTIEETRLQGLIESADRGAFPVGLNYAGAKTKRWSGGAAGTKLNCFTPGHEVLTPTGWVRVEEYKPGTPIMQWWPDGTASWDENPGWEDAPYRGEVLSIRGPVVDVTVTPEHRFVKMRDAAEPGVMDVTAAQLAASSGADNIPVYGVYTGTGNGLSPDHVRVLTALAADGHIRPDGGWVFGFRKSRKIARLIALLDGAGVPYRVNTYPSVTHITVTPPNLPEWHHIGKGFGPWVLGLSGESMDALLDEVAYWDGTPNTRSGRTTVTTVVEAQADWIVTVARLRGVAAIRYAYPCPTASTGMRYDVYFRAGRHTSVDTARHITRTQYIGRVYCPKVQSSYIYVRRNGNVCITGNCQNLPSKSQIKDFIHAPEGKMIIGADLSNIELRVGLWLAGEMDKLEALGKGRDLYKDFATKVFDVAYEDVDPAQRFIGKTSQLSLIFGVGAAKLQQALIIGAKNFLGLDLDISLDECKRIVAIYRAEHKGVVSCWDQGKDALWSMHADAPAAMFHKGLAKVEGRQGIRLPSGLHLRYHNLRQEEKDGQRNWVCDARRGTDKLYGAKVFQQFTQATARCVLAERIPIIHRRYPVKLTIHDANYCLAPEEEAGRGLAWVLKQMTVAPQWMPGIPLDAEGGYGRTLKDCGKAILKTENGKLIHVPTKKVISR